MSQRSFMTFDAPSQPETTDETGEPEPSGRTLAASLARGLEGRGVRISEPVDQHDSYGWYFVVGSEGRPQRVWCMLQESDSWLLVTKPEVPFLKRLFGTRVDLAEHQRVCQALHAVAEEHPELSNVRWFTTAEFETGEGGADRP